MPTTSCGTQSSDVHLRDEQNFSDIMAILNKVMRFGDFVEFESFAQFAA